ncbi:MAG: RDD family protein [Gemmatimonadota bacterium]
MARQNDPREIITPDAFSVAPDLLGLPLARPWRRLAAILLDLLLIGLLANVPAIFLALAAGVFFFRLSIRGGKTGTLGRLTRATFGCLGAVVLFTAGTVMWGSRFFRQDRVILEATGPRGEAVPVTIGEAGMALSDVARLVSSGDDSAAAAGAADRLVRLLEEKGIDAADARTALGDVEGGGAAAIEAALDRAENEADAPEAPSLDSLLAVYVRARAAADSAGAEESRSRLAQVLAEPELADRDADILRLSARNERLAEETAVARREAEEARKQGFVRRALKFADELGLGIGWSGLYFTFFTGLWRGRTPGKRLLGIRVLRLDGKPISWWIAFERFGGYAASVFTGLTGFLQVLWDRNRQALHDKVAETVVIRDVRPGVTSAGDTGTSRRPGGPSA